MYIGYDLEADSYERNRRWATHKRNYNHIGHYEYDKYLYKAMRKYNVENFEFEIIDTTAQNIDEICKMEIYYIKELETLIPNGYNMDEGGWGGSLKLEHYSEEEQIRRRKRFSDAQRKRFNDITPEERKELGEISRKAREKLWRVESPRGEVSIVKGLKRFCQENDLNYNTLFASKRYNKKVHGWLVELI